MATTHADMRPVDITEAELDRLVEQDPHDAGRHNARLTDYGHHVSAIIDYLQGSDWNIAKVASAFHLPEVAVRAAIQYYERHQDLIDAKLLLEREGNDA